MIIFNILVSEKNQVHAAFNRDPDNTYRKYKLQVRQPSRVLIVKFLSLPDHRRYAQG